MELHGGWQATTLRRIFCWSSLSLRRRCGRWMWLPAMYSGGPAGAGPALRRVAACAGPCAVSPPSCCAPGAAAAASGAAGAALGGASSAVKRNTPTESLWQVNSTKDCGPKHTLISSQHVKVVAWTVIAKELKGGKGTLAEDLRARTLPVKRMHYHLFLLGLRSLQERSPPPHWHGIWQEAPQNSQLEAFPKGSKASFMFCSRLAKSSTDRDCRVNWFKPEE